MENPPTETSMSQVGRNDFKCEESRPSQEKNTTDLQRAIQFFRSSDQESGSAAIIQALPSQPTPGMTLYTCTGLTQADKKCSFKSPDMDFMSRHMRTAHRVSWNCELCPFKTAGRTDLLKHKSASHKDFKCDQCGFAFYTADKLARHQAAMNHNRDTIQ